MYIFYQPVANVRKKSVTSSKAPKSQELPRTGIIVLEMQAIKFQCQVKSNYSIKI